MAKHCAEKNQNNSYPVEFYLRTHWFQHLGSTKNRDFRYKKNKAPSVMLLLSKINDLVKKYSSMINSHSALI